MSKLFVVLACLAVVLAVASAEPRYHKLQKVGCSITEVAACAGEIEGMKHRGNMKQNI